MNGVWFCTEYFELRKICILTLTLHCIGSTYAPKSRFVYASLDINDRQPGFFLLPCISTSLAERYIHVYKGQLSDDVDGGK